jgi:hypothetical protein
LRTLSAAVALDALGGIIEPGKREAEVVPGLVPDALVTFGAGINQLASQKVYSAGLHVEFQISPVKATILLLATTLLVLAMPFISTFEDHLKAVSATIFAPLIIICFFVLLLNRVKDENLAYSIAIAIAFVGWGMIVLLFLYALLRNPIVFLWIYVLLAANSFAWFASSVLSHQMKKIVSAPVRRPPGLARWDDIYASADPVPNGPTMPEGASDASIEIWNQGSLIADHTAYWSNIDEFVLRVARVCAETAQSPWTGELPCELNLADKRAAWRVGFLRLARWSAALLVCLVLAGLFRRLTVIPVLLKAPDSVPTAFAQFAHLIAYVALALWLTLRLMLWPWKAWVRKEQDMVLAGVQPEGKEDAKHALSWLWSVVWALVGAAIMVVLPLADLSQQLAVGLLLTINIYPAARLTTNILIKVRPPPGAASSTGH